MQGVMKNIFIDERLMTVLITLYNEKFNDSVKDVYFV
jgi:hypothetical protein